MKTLTLKMDGEDIKTSEYSKPMNGYVTGKLKAYKLKFYWLEPREMMVLEKEQDTFSSDEINMIWPNRTRDF